MKPAWAMCCFGCALAVAAPSGRAAEGPAAPPRVAVAPPAAAPKAAAPPSASARLRVKAVTLRVFHRVFPDFRDQVSPRLREDFRVGDTEYTARVVEFVADFTMDLKTHKVTSRSNEPRNPAFRLIVKKAGVPQDTAWAFLNMPPHFARNSMLAFQVQRIEFENHAPVPPDTTAAPAGGERK